MQTTTLFWNVENKICKTHLPYPCREVFGAAYDQSEVRVVADAGIDLAAFRMLGERSTI